MSATYSGSGSSPSSSSGYSDTRAGPTSSAIEGAADGLADGLEREDIGGNVHGALSQIDEALEDRPSPRAQRLRTRLERIDEKVETIIDKTKVRARAVAETARRARDAPPKVAGDLTDAAKTYATGIAANVGFAIAAAFIGLLALTVLTVGMVQGLNDAWGAPRGTFLVAGAYFLVAFALYSTGKGRARRAQLKARAHLLDAKGEIQRVARPMQRAFAGDMDAEHRGVAASRPERPIRQRDGFDLERQRTPDPSLSVKPYRGGPH